MAKALAITGLAGLLMAAGLVYVDEFAPARAALDCAAAPELDPGYCD